MDKYQAEKVWLVQKMALREQERYNRVYSEIGEKISSAQLEIEDCKAELVRAKQIRRNKQEYDAWAKKVMELPDREQTIIDLKKETEKLNELQQTQKDLENKLELRKKQFAVLLTAVQDLQTELEEDAGEQAVEDMIA